MWAEVVNKSFQHVHVDSTLDFCITVLAASSL